MKWLAVDYGDSRTGLAGCDAGETITSPITPQIEEKSMNKVAAGVRMDHHGGCHRSGGEHPDAGERFAPGGCAMRGASV